MFVDIKSLNADLLLDRWYRHGKKIDRNPNFGVLTDLLRLFDNGVNFLPDFYDLPHLDALLLNFLPGFGLNIPLVVICVIKVVLLCVEFEGKVPSNDLNANVAQSERHLHDEYLPLNIAVADEKEATYVVI